MDENRETRKYDVFVSYSRQDSDVVRPVVDRLAAEGYSYWMDIDGIESGDEFRSKLVDAIEKSRVFVFFSSADSNASKWTTRELSIADDRDKPIIPVRLDQSPYSKAAKFILTGLDYIDFQTPQLRMTAIDRLLRSVREKVGAPCASNEEDGPSSLKELVLPGGVSMRFRWCPPGTFMMGSPVAEGGHAQDEVRHRVRLTKGFWMGETEVSQRQWKALMGSNPSNPARLDNPVVNVSWNDCVAFMQKANALLGCTMRLPTEAEWEYACRAGTNGPYAGTGALDEMGWYSGGRYGEAQVSASSHPVGKKRPNAWGLYDMHGNVWEWCSDWYGPYPAEDVTDPVGPASGKLRVRRGGSWQDEAAACRSAYRFVFAPDSRHSLLGFRVVLEPETGDCSR